MCQKLPLFPIIKILPHKRPNFAIRVFWANHKFLLYYFQKSTSGWLIHFALALISPPLALSTKTGTFLAQLTPLPHQKYQWRVKRQIEHKNELGIKYTNTGVQWKYFHCPSSPLPFNAPLRLEREMSPWAISIMF